MRLPLPAILVLSNSDLSVFEKVSKDHDIKELHTFSRVWTQGLVKSCCVTRAV